MAIRLSRLIAILTAWSTVLAGMPLMAMAPPTAPGSGGCFSASPRDLDDAAEHRGESGTEVEETETERDEFDAGIDLIADHRGPRRLKNAFSGPAAPDACPAKRSACPPLLPIRGPPARG